MKSGWQIKKLEEVCQFSNGLWKGECPPFVNVGVIRNTNFTKEGTLDDSDIAYLDVEKKKFAKRRLQYGDIILEKSGGGPKQPVGRVVLFNKIKGDFSFSNFTSALRVLDPNSLDSRYLHKFLYWTYLSGITEGMQSNSTGIRNLDNDAYKAINIDFPKLSEQQRIVGILDEAFDGIANAKTNAEKNLQNAQELFESYLNGVFTNPGENWEEKSFDKVCVLQRGFDLPTRSRNTGGFPLVSSNGITDWINIWKVKAPGVVTGRSGTIGNIHYIEKDFWPLNTALYIKDFHGNYPRFVYYFLKKFDIGKYSSGSGVPTLNRNNVHGVLVKFPKSILEQQKIVSKLDALAGETKTLESNYQKKLAALDDLKKTMLYQAFSGEL
jgi:type I restriction enzyme S subunit